MYADTPRKQKLEKIKSWLLVLCNLNNHLKCRKFFYGKNGLEIAGPSRIFTECGKFPIYPLAANVDNYIFPRSMEWGGCFLDEGKHFNYWGNKLGYQFLGESTDLSKVKSGSYDFVAASQVLEHIANPFKALLEWLRVLKNGGFFLLVVPDKDRTYDHNRPLTAFEHLLNDYKMKVGEDDLTHLPEIVSLTDLQTFGKASTRESLRRQCERNPEHRVFHHHVFDAALLARIFHHFKLQVLFSDFVRPDNIVFLGKKDGFLGEEAKNK